ncbi:hypothetical protein FRC12_015313 [Ceratobasidium sp. 428]|nr:hypothetical protein FRC12_015313 [Ceratobasidium sp. 428]
MPRRYSPQARKRRPNHDIQPTINKTSTTSQSVRFASQCMSPWITVTWAASTQALTPAAAFVFVGHDNALSRRAISINHYATTEICATTFVTAPFATSTTLIRPT